MLLRKTLSILVTLSILQWAPLRLAAQEIPPEDFGKLLKLIKPAADESYWSEIPWMINMGEARKKAAAEGKPLVVWTMSGEPLGHC